MFYKIGEDWINLEQVQAITLKALTKGWSVRFYIGVDFLEYELDEIELQQLEDTIRKFNQIKRKEE